MSSVDEGGMRNWVWLIPFLSACATDTVQTYAKPGAKDGDFERAFTECKVKRKQARIPEWSAPDWQEFMDTCLKGEGWNREPSPR